MAHVLGANLKPGQTIQFFFRYNLLFASTFKSSSDAASTIIRFTAFANTPSKQKGRRREASTFYSKGF